MAIEYALYKDNLARGTEQYTARVLKTSSAGLDTIADRIAGRGTHLSRPVIFAILTAIIAVIQRLLADRVKIKIDGLIKMVPKIQGKFRGRSDKLDPARHQLNIAVNALSSAGKHLRENAVPTKNDTVLPQPVQYSFLDNATGRHNETITPNRLGILTGSKMLFDPHETEEGIFIIYTAAQREKRITELVTNKPSQQIFHIPGFDYNNVHIEVRKRFTKNSTLRTSRLPIILHNTKPKFKIIPTKINNNNAHKTMSLTT